MDVGHTTIVRGSRTYTYRAPNGDTFLYRKMPPSEFYRLNRERITDERTREPDYLEIQREALQRYLLNWNGPVDETGQPLPFDQNLIFDLPPNVQATLSDCIMGYMLPASIRVALKLPAEPPPDVTEVSTAPAPEGDENPLADSART